MRRGAKWTLIGLGAAALFALPTAVVLMSRPVQVYTDADTIRRAAALESPRDVLWQPPRPLSEAINAPLDVYEPRLSWDGLTLFFVRGKAGGNADIFSARRTVSGWTEPTPIVAINSEHDDLGPEPAADGSSIYFYSDRPGGSGGYDLWVARRRADAAADDANAWLPPTNLGPTVNSAYNDYGPALMRDGSALYFASNRPTEAEARTIDPNAWSATLREDLYRRTYDLYSCDVKDGVPAAAKPVNALNSPSNEGAPCISPAGDFLYFASDRPGGQGGFDLYRARRMRDGFAPLENLGTSVNTSANELDPGLAQLGFALYFSSNRPASRGEAATSAPSNEPPRYGVYYTTSREVYLDSDARPIDWAALWAKLWPNLIWLLIGLLALLLLALLFRDLRDRRLSLLARCLLVSVALHSLLLTAFGFWRVSSAIGEFVRGKGRLQISIAAAGVGDSLSAQIRASLTDAPTVAAASVDAPRATILPLYAPDVRLAAMDAPATVVEAQPERDKPAAREATPADSRRIEATPMNVNRVELSTRAPAEDASREQANESSVAVTAAETSYSARRSVDVAASPTTELRPVAVAPDRAAISVEAQPVAELTKPGDATPVRAARRSGPTEAIPSAATIFMPTSAPALEGDGAAVDGSARDATVTVRAADGSGARARVALTASSQPSALAAIAPEKTRIPMGEPDKSGGGGGSAAVATEDARPRPGATRGGDVRAQLGAIPTLAVATPTESAVPGGSKTEVKEATPTVPALKPGGAFADARPRMGVSAPTASPRLIDVPTGRNGSRGLGRSDVSLASDSVMGTVGDADALRTPGTRRTATPIDGPIAAGSAATMDVAIPIEPETDGAASGGLLAPAIGTMHGLVRDKASGAPLANATVRVDLAGSDPVSAHTNDAGEYTLALPQVPENFAVSATADGYEPAARNVPGSDLASRGIKADFELEPETEMVVAVEDEPEVHHLGNDAFEGAINSQFQRKSEGAALIGEFDLREIQTPPHVERAEVTLLVKGVQCPHQVFVNEKLLRAHVDKSPGDGSFGEIAVLLDPRLLRAGTNTIEIRAVSCRGDLDDFEFVNVQIRLRRKQSEPSPEASDTR
jgi:hypothetical protein